MTQRYLCIHGHFYQPPRENPWLEEVELQDSAHPYHDWNKRISAECYAPNTAARILDTRGWITEIVNNYSRISFNFGPTLLSWMERNDRPTYEALIQSDVESRENFGGHGSAMAQCYNHIIMPLANSADKLTQVIWGIKDFVYRFGRKPEGMWLPETAVDLETLEILAVQGLKFTILAPNQAKAIRKMGERAEWRDVSASRVDPRRPYRVILASGRFIDVFFYDGPVSRGVAFEHLLDNASALVGRLMGLFQDNSEPQIVHIATDGETYGHHHPRGDMALASAIRKIESERLAKITNYSQFLELHPPEYEAQIFENSSWSCVHGVERWRNNCGCNSGSHPGWHQMWRRPLREAMDWLRDQLAALYNEEGRKYFADPWEARNGYIDVVLNRSRDNTERFLAQHASRSLDPSEKVIVLKLLEMQRHAMLMFTSCGWFFDEVSGLENIQILRYAARAIQLASEVGCRGLETVFLDHLRRVQSNIFEYHHAAHIYEKFVQPSVVDLERVGAHYAVSSLFEEYPKTAQIFSYSAESQEYQRQEKGRRKLAVGRTTIRSEITWEDVNVDFAFEHWGDQQIIGGVRLAENEKAFVRMKKEILKGFRWDDPLRFSRLIKRHFSGRTYSLQHLFKDEQIKVLYQILDDSFGDVEDCLRQINEHHYPIIQVVKQLNVPLPRMLHNTVSVMIDTDLLRALGSDPIDFERLKALVDETMEYQIEVDKTTLVFIARRRINTLMQGFLRRPRDFRFLQSVARVLEILKPLDLSFEFWTAQNIYFWVGKRIYNAMRLKALQGNQNAKKWLESFDRLGDFFHVKFF